jgi:hypothetical protein
MEVDCPMDLKAQLRAARAGSNLLGSFVSKAAYKNTCPEILFDLQLNKDAGKTNCTNSLSPFKGIFLILNELTSKQSLQPSVYY